jgi:peptidoglycan hydrolase-like protein with peptidoglycan-binding domain
MFRSGIAVIVEAEVKIMALSWPLEHEGSAGENVRSIQYLLDAHGSDLVVDGVFGPKTNAAVRAFQAEHGLTVDGIVGDQTWPKLIIQVAQGSTGDAVRAVQSQIHSRSGWLAVDGIFGPETDSAVRVFQQITGVGVDGIAGPVTWNTLVSAYLRADNGSAAADIMYQAWTGDDRAGARTEATEAAVDALFTRTWHASEGWAFDECGVAAGTFYCTWKRTGEELVLSGNDSTGAPFYYVHTVTFQAG